MVKNLFLIAIALVVPLFFALMFVQGTYNRLNRLRERCHSARARQEDHSELAAQYDELRKSFPARWVAAIFRFGPLDAMETAPAGSSGDKG